MSYTATTALISALLAAGVAGCGGASSKAAAPADTRPTGSAPAPVASAALVNADPVIGTWQSAALPAATWVATFRRAGGSAADAKAFVAQLGGSAGSTKRIIARVDSNQWVELEQSDNATPEVGSQVTWQRVGAIVQLQDPGVDHCQMGYRVQVLGDTLTIKVLFSRPVKSPECGAKGWHIQRTLWETSTFHRVG